MLEIKICKNVSFAKSILPFWLAESGLFAQKAVVSYKGWNPNILNVLEIENCNSFCFSQNFLPFWLAESGLFAQKAVDSTKVEIPTF